MYFYFWRGRGEFELVRKKKAGAGDWRPLPKESEKREIQEGEQSTLSNAAEVTQSVGSGN